ncbi:hypothetical protein WA158_001394 [Blastocystis sp. Blastoise]
MDTKVSQKKKQSPFDQVKANKLSKLRDAFDRSKKGSLDAPIVDLIYYINTLENYVTTSSCSGRFSIFCANYVEEKGEQMSKGGKWIFIEHRTITNEEVDEILNNHLPSCKGVVLFKLEPFLLHVECRNIESAQEMLTIAIQCGFRESGILAGTKTMLGIRTTSNNLELPIYENGSIGINSDYLHYLVQYGNVKFNNNLERIHMFFEALKSHYSLSIPIQTEETSLSSFSSLPPSLWNWKPIPEVANQNASNTFVSLDNITDLLRRRAHSSCNISDDFVCLYGGFGGKENNKDDRLGDIIYIQKIDENVHISSPSFTICPPKRQYSSLCKYGQNMLLFAGRQGPSKAYNDVWILDIEKNIWKEVVIEGNGPKPRWHTAMCSVSRETIAIYGGRDETHIYGDMWLLRIIQREDQYIGSWSLLYDYMDPKYIEDIGDIAPNMDPNNENIGSIQDNKGPGALFMHNMVPICMPIENNSSPTQCNHDYICIFGGYNNLEGHASESSIYIFKLSKRYWNPINICENDVYRRSKKRRDTKAKPMNTYSIKASNNRGNEDGNRDMEMDTLDIDEENHDSRENMEIEKEVLIPEDSIPSGNGTKRNNNHENEQGFKYTSILKYVSLSPSLYLIYGYETSHFKCYLMDISTYISTLNVYIYPLPSLEVSLSHYMEKDILLMQFTLNKLGNMLLLLGGGGNVFWTCHYNHSIYTYIPSTLYHYISTNKQCPLQVNNKLSLPVSDIHKDIIIKKDTKVIPIKNHYSLVISDIKQLKSFKTCLESLQIYDKTRKIYKDIHGNANIPITISTIDLYKEKLPQNISYSIINDENATIPAEKPVKQLKDIDQMKIMIEQYCKDNSFDLSCISSFPPKFERIQDILLFPKGFNIPTLESQNETIEVLYKDICTLMKCKRIASYEDVDCGPKRESHTRVLYPANADGWVEVKQNNVIYSYNIEKVMYSSGNVTERCRMKTLSLQSNEYVVDMYAGIGYFTLPLLLRPEVSHVTALEWNPDSIEALTKNVKLNHVEQKCTILCGDNRLISKPYYNKADRVLLGLLPSSRPGWETAIRLLKPTGGMLHIHENIHDNEYNTFIESLPIQLSTIATSNQKSFQFTITHVEKVKSYAPRVYHYVLDVEVKQI